MNTISQRPYRIRAVHCDYRAGNEEVYQALRRATAPLDGAWERLSRARRIAIKFNQDWQPHRLITYQGQRQQLVSDTVGRAVLRLLQERTRAEIFAIDVGVESLSLGPDRERGYMMLPVLREFGVPLIDGVIDRVAWVNVPGGGQMFERYPIPQSIADADEVVSVQKIKNHAFMGVTLCLKNLFGLLPLMPHGRPRHYYHHLVRMAYMLADLGRIIDPALNILDGMVCQAGQEWGLGEEPRLGNTLVAGEQVIATDTVGIHLMGHDPRADWLTPPFHRDRNAVLVAAQGGFGSVDMNAIDFQSEVQAPIGEFFAKQMDAPEIVVSWLRTTAEQALFYRQHQRRFIDQYAGKYILLQMGEVRWTSDDGQIHASRRVLAGEHPAQAMWLKYVDPAEEEGEHFEVYENLLDHPVFH